MNDDPRSPGASSDTLPQTPESSCWLNILLGLLLATCAVRLWLMPMVSSFWIDEMVTAFVVDKGANHPSLAIAPQVSKSIYYLLPTLTSKLLGASEAFFRLPSVLAMALAVFFVTRLSRRLIHPLSGWFAAFACFALPGINYQASDARPYALGSCVTAASLYWLVRWLDSGKIKHAIVFIVLASLVWRIHLVYWPVYVLFVACIAVRVARNETRVRLPGAALAILAIGLLLIPVFIDALQLFLQPQDHVVTGLPSLDRLRRSLRFNLLACSAIGTWILNRWYASPGKGFFRKLIRRPTVDLGFLKAPSSLMLVAGWWLCQPLCLFIYSYLTGTSVFVERYLSVSLPGAALAATGVAGVLLPPAYWKRASVAMGVGALLCFGQLSNFWPRHDPSDWRAAAQAVKSMNLPADTPVICPSPFVEAKPPAWQENTPIASFLYTHLWFYPIPGRLYTFPYAVSPEAKIYARRLIGETLAHSDRFLIYGGLRIDAQWRRWLVKQPEFAGWAVKRIADFGAINIVVFEKPTAK